MTRVIEIIKSIVKKTGFHFRLRQPAKMSEITPTANKKIDAMYDWLPSSGISNNPKPANMKTMPTKIKMITDRG